MQNKIRKPSAILQTTGNHLVELENALQTPISRAKVVMTAQF
jgi:hypothetical protein